MKDLVKDFVKYGHMANATAVITGGVTLVCSFNLLSEPSVRRWISTALFLGCYIYNRQLAVKLKEEAMEEESRARQYSNVYYPDP